MQTTIELVYRTESRRVLATLIRLLGDFDLAEEALHDAFRAALEQWPRDGVPANPRAWLVSAGRFKAIDSLRRRARFDARSTMLAERLDVARRRPAAWADRESVEDDRLRLIFTCCHPALAPDAQVALTLREVCGLTTEEIARAFLTPRADAGAAHRARQGEDPRRAHSLPGAGARPSCPSGSTRVLRVIYLVFNEGYSASSGASLTRARSVGRGDPAGAAAGRAAARAGGARAARADAAARVAARGAHVADGRADPARRSGSLALEPRADRRRRRRWCERALASRRVRPVHAAGGDRGGARRGARRADATDWDEIVGLYDVLLRAEPSPVVELNRAVAVAMRDGPAAGLALDRRDPRARRAGGLPPGPRGARGPLPPAGPDGGGARLLRARARARAAGAGAAVPEAPAGRVVSFTRSPAASG